MARINVSQHLIHAKLLNRKRFQNLIRNISNLGMKLTPKLTTLRVKMIPHDQKKEKGGQDSYFIAEDIIGVADGVGGWADMGVDPGIYSKNFCNVAKQYHLQNNRDAQNQPKFQKTLGQIIYHTNSVVTDQGSCTIIMATLDPNSNVIKTANFGDCGVMILRKDKQSKQLKVIFRSKQMQKDFNFPYQSGYQDNGDNLEYIQNSQIEIQNNDIIIMGSDGLFDNVFDDQLIKQVSRYVQTQEQIQQPNVVAEAIANQAYDFSKMKSRKSPFEVHSRGYFSGGKPDDITVLVAQIKLNNNDQEKKQ